MSGLDKHTGSGVAESAMGRAVFAAPAGKTRGPARLAGASRFGFALAGAALVLLVAGGEVLARAGTTRVIITGPNVRTVQVAAVSRDNGRLSVENEPILRVIDELNRDAERKVKVMDRSDPRYRKMIVTGQFTLGRPERIIDYMRAAGIRVLVDKDEGGNFLLRLAPASS